MYKRLTLVLAVAAAFIGVVIFTDFQLLLGTLDSIPPSMLAAMVGIFLIGAVLKGFRWAFYLRAAHLNIRWRDGLTSFLAAMSTSPIPGGSWLAPRLAQEHGHIRMRQAAPTLFVSYIVDAVTVPTLVLILFLLTDQPLYSFAIPALGLTLGVVLLSMGRSTRIWNLVAAVLSRTRFTRRWLPEERDIQMRVQAQMRPKILIFGAIFSIAATILSAAFLMVLVNALAYHKISSVEALWIHSLSEAAGIALPVPGGFGVTDSSITGMLTQSGIGFRRATFLALLLRSSEAGLRVLFGTATLFVRYEGFLISALDFRSRTRGAYRHACKVPGIRTALSPFKGYFPRPSPAALTPAPADGPPAEDISLAD